MRSHLIVAAVLGLTILMIISTAPVVHAQITSLSNLNAPSRGFLGKDITVSFDVTWAKGYNGVYLDVAVWDVDDSTFASGSGYTSSYSMPCEVIGTGQYSNSAFCAMTPTSKSGSITVTFTLKFHMPKVYHLEAGSMLEDAYYNGISDSYNQQDFSITITDKVALNVRAPDPVTVTVDGIPHNPGNVFLDVDLGTHSISVPAIVDVNPGERLRFDYWSDGSTGTSKIVDLQDDTTYSAAYVTQYQLALVTSQGSTTGEGWFDEGTVANFTVPSSLPMNEFLGSLGAKYDFQGWYEGNNTLLAPSNDGSLTMKRPSTLTARWTPNYTTPLLFLGLLVALIVAILIVIARHKHLAKSNLEKPEVPLTEPKTSARAETETAALEQKTPTEKFCLNCGSKLPLESKFCNKCGTVQS